MKNTKLGRFIIAVSLVLGLFSGAAKAQEPYLGEIRCFAFNFVPNGWFAADGQLLPISQYTALFALVGTMYGGNGTTNFALPDLRGRALIHTDGNNYQVGQTGGAATATIGVANLPPHSHNFATLGSNNDANSVSPAGKVAAAKARTTLYTDPANVVTMAAGTTSATGSGVPLPTMSPYLTGTCAIAYAGIFPSRN